MPKKANQLPRSGKGDTVPPPKRNPLPMYLAGGAALLIIIGILLMTNLRRGSSGAASAGQVTGQPRLAVDRQQIIFGRVPLDKPVKASFTLTNVGDQPLQIVSQPIVDVKQGC